MEWPTLFRSRRRRLIALCAVAAALVWGIAAWMWGTAKGTVVVTNESSRVITAFRVDFDNGSASFPPILPGQSRSARLDGGRVEFFDHTICPLSFTTRDPKRIGPDRYYYVGFGMSRPAGAPDCRIFSYRIRDPLPGERPDSLWIEQSTQFGYGLSEAVSDIYHRRMPGRLVSDFNLEPRPAPYVRTPPKS